MACWGPEGVENVRNGVKFSAFVHVPNISDFDCSERSRLPEWPRSRVPQGYAISTNDRGCHVPRDMALHRSREIPFHPVLYVAQLKSPLAEINSAIYNRDLLPRCSSSVLLALGMGRQYMVLVYCQGVLSLMRLICEDHLEGAMNAPSLK